MEKLKEELKKFKHDTKRTKGLKNVADLDAKINEEEQKKISLIKEQERLEMIKMVCSRNLAKNDEWINCLEREIKNCGDMIVYLDDKINGSHSKSSQKDDSEKLTNDLFQERRQKFDEFFEAMREKTAALKPGMGRDDIIDTHKNSSENNSERDDLFFQSDVSPSHRGMMIKSSVNNLKLQQETLENKKTEGLSALKVLMRISGVDDPSKTAEMLKFAKQTEDLEKVKQMLEKKLNELKAELKNQEDILIVNIFIHFSIEI